MDTRQSLLGRLRNSNRSEDWNQLVGLYGPVIEQWLVRSSIPPGDAKDLVQEVLVTLVTEVKRFHHNGRIGAFRKWLRNITHNRCRRYWSCKHRRNSCDHGEQILAELEDPNSELSKTLDLDHDRHVLSTLLDSVQGDFADVTIKIFNRYVIEGNDAKQVAKEFGVKLGQVYKARFRVMAKLQVESQRLHGSVFKEVSVQHS